MTAPYGEVYVVTCVPSGKLYVGQTTQGWPRGGRGTQGGALNGCLS